MIVTAWNNGAHSRNGSGYGFRVHTADRDEYFKPEWNTIFIHIEDGGEPEEIPIDKERFWSEGGHDLISTGVGKWLRKNGLSPWPKGNPPTFVLEPMEDNHFQVVRAPKRAASKI